MKKIITKPILLYTIIFVTVFLVVTIPTQIRSGTFFSFGLFTDGFKQHLIFMRDYTFHIRDGINGVPLQLFRYDLGLGGDFFTNYAFYSLFDPLTLIAYLLPRTCIEEAFYLIGITRLYLAGLMMLLCAKRFKISKPIVLVVIAIYYVFNVTTAYTAFRHPMFVNGPLLFPLIIIGIDKVLAKENPALLIISSFLALITQFYFFMFACIGFELIVIIRLFLQIKDRKFKIIVKDFILTNFFFLLGALIGGFVLFPQLIASLNSGRIADKGLIFFNSIDYVTFFASFFIPIVGAHYTSAIGNIVVFLIVLAYIFTRSKRWESILFIVLSIMIFIPIFGYIFNLFAYVNNRWTYLLIAPTSLLLGYALENLSEIKETSFNRAVQIITVIIMAIGGFLLISLVSSTLSLALIIICSIIVFALLIYFSTKIFKLNLITRLRKHFTYPKFIRYTLILSFATLLIMFFSYFFSMTSSSDLAAYEDPISFSALEEDQEMYRVEQNVFALGSTSLANDSLVLGYNGTHSYNTMGNGYIHQTLAYYDVIRLSSTAGYEGFNQRSALLAINNVKYLIVRDSEKTNIPYGFSYFATTQLKKTIPDKFNSVGLGFLDGEYEDAYIYRNDYFLPFGFVYDQYIAQDELINLSAAQKESILIKAALLNEDVDLPKYSITPSIIKNAALITGTENIELFEGGFIALNNASSLKLQIDGATNHELLIEIENLTSANPKVPFTFQYQSSNSRVEETTYGVGTNFYYDNPNHLVNLGYYNKDSVEVTISIPAGKYFYKSINTYIRPMGEVISDINKLQESTLQNLVFNTSGFTANIDLTKKGLLHISIPYHDGFKAYVDDVETPILLTNIGYMGIILDSGAHDICFEYTTPGLKIGLIVSIIASFLSLFIVIALLFFRKYRASCKTTGDYIRAYFSSNCFIFLTYMLALGTWIINNPFIFMAYSSITAVIIISTNAKRINLVTLLFAALIIPRANDYNSNVAIYFITVGFASPFIFYDIFTSKKKYLDLLFYAFLAFFVANGLSLINTTKLNIYPALMGVFICFAYLLIYWYFRANSKGEDKETIFKNSFALGLAIAIEFIFYLITYSGEIVGKNIDLNWAQSNGIAMLVLLLIPLNIAFYVSKQKHTYLLLGVICEVCVLILTLSKGAYISLALIIIPMFIIALKLVPCKKRLFIDLFFAIILIVFIAWQLTQIDKIAIGIENYFATMDARGWFNDPARLEIYEKGLAVFKEYPLFGAGSYTTVAGLSSNYDHYHNFLIHTLATTGIVGGLAFLFFLFALIKKTLKKDPFSLFSLMTIIAMLIHGLFDNSWYKPLVMVAITIIASQLKDKIEPAT